MLDLLLAGMGTRRAGMGHSAEDGLVSAGQVGRLAKRLEAEVRVFHTRRPVAGLDLFKPGQIGYARSRHQRFWLCTGACQPC